LGWQGRFLDKNATKLKKKKTGRASLTWKMKRPPRIRGDPKRGDVKKKEKGKISLSRGEWWDKTGRKGMFGGGAQKVCIGEIVSGPPVGRKEERRRVCVLVNTGRGSAKKKTRLA